MTLDEFIRALQQIRKNDLIGANQVIIAEPTSGNPYGSVHTIEFIEGTWHEWKGNIWRAPDIILLSVDVKIR